MTFTNLSVLLLKQNQRHLQFLRERLKIELFSMVDNTVLYVD